MKMKGLLICLLAVILLVNLAGCASGGQDTSSAPETTKPLTDEEILQQRRELVVSKMRQMQSVLWRSDADFQYTLKNGSTGVENDSPSSVVDVVKGRLYMGVPYTHGTGSYEAFLDFAVSQDEKGIYTLSGLSEEILSGDNSAKSVYTPRIGNDCADAVYWSWAQISPTIRFTITTYMTEKYGCLKVGDYTCDPEKLIKTEEVCLQNGEKVMYEAYAKLQPGDAVVYSVDSGHTMMVSDVKVIRKEDGSIDKLRSHVKIIDQTSGNIGNEKFYYDETLKENVYYCGNIDKIYNFTSLFEKGYLPVTCKELVDPSPLVKAKVLGPGSAVSLDTMFEGEIASNYRISHVTVSIIDSQGEAVQQSTIFCRDKEMFAFKLSRFIDPKEQSVMRGVVNPDKLSAGTYRCNYTCQVATGEVFDVASFEFKK